MSIKQTIWAHGNSARVEANQPKKYLDYFNSGTRLIGLPGSGLWVHFPIPSSVIVDDQRLKLESAMLRFRCGSSKVRVAHFHLTDGENRFLIRDNVNLWIPDWNTPFHRETVHPEHVVLWGLCISVYVTFNGHTDAENTIDFAAAGCDFIL